MKATELHPKNCMKILRTNEKNMAVKNRNIGVKHVTNPQVTHLQNTQMQKPVQQDNLIGFLTIDN